MCHRRIHVLKKYVMLLGVEFPNVLRILCAHCVMHPACGTRVCVFKYDPANVVAIVVARRGTFSESHIRFSNVSSFVLQLTTGSQLLLPMRTCAKFSPTDFHVRR